jgi:hypothetical protein
MKVIEEHYDENGELHRTHELGPATIYSDGTQCYYEHGQLHSPHQFRSCGYLSIS